MENRKVYIGGREIDQWGTFKRNKGDIIEKFKHEGKEYVLVKNFEGHYNKALMYQEENNSNHYILISYNTIVAEYVEGKIIEYGYYSETTKRHLNSFLEWFGLEGMNKKEIIENENKFIEWVVA